MSHGRLHSLISFYFHSNDPLKHTHYSLYSIFILTTPDNDDPHPPNSLCISFCCIVLNFRFVSCKFWVSRGKWLFFFRALIILLYTQEIASWLISFKTIVCSAVPWWIVHVMSSRSFLCLVTMISSHPAFLRVLIFPRKY